MSDSEEQEFNDESSEDAPLASLGDKAIKEESGGKRRRSVVSYAEDEEEDDDESEDDVPLSSLASPKKKKPAATKKKTAAPAKKKAKKSSSTPAPKSTTSSSSTDYNSASAALYGTECNKGLLVQRLLCRWWYAIEWPDPAAIPKQPPPHYDAMDGFPGVYVCTEGDEVGAIKDFRDKEACPNFNNMAKKTSEELQTLLIKALTEQRKQLVQAEGPGTPTEKELDALLKWANKVKPAAADKEAIKVLKASNQSLE